MNFAKVLILCFILHKSKLSWKMDLMNVWIGDYISDVLSCYYHAQEPFCKVQYLYEQVVTVVEFF